MGANTSTLPLHKKEKDIKALPPLSKSPRKLLAFVLVGLIILYSFLSSKDHVDKEVLYIPSQDYNINPLFWAPSLSEQTSKSAYPPEYFTPEALLENELNPVSAVLLRVTDDDESIVSAVKQLLNHPFISDIYIHNLVKHRPLTRQSLHIDPQLDITIEILQSDEHLNSMARFTTCATASRLYCYFQDDTYLNPYMDSLYTNFLRFPTLIHANAKPSHYERQMKWRFYNKEIKLHTGYADFRYGAFVPRWKVQSFLTQLGKSGLGSDSIRHAEHYFGIWMNQYPWLLSNPPYMANGDKATEKNVAFDTSLDHYTYDAVRHLQRSLTADQSEAPQDYFERTEEPPVLSYRDVRSSCANDRCLFISNMDPFVSPQQVPFDYQNITSISKLEQAYNGLLSLPGSIEWEEHSFHRAADSDPNSCWNTIHAPRQKDYFGLILVGTANTKTVVIHTPQKIQNPERQLEVSVLQSDSEWTRCKITDQTIQNTDRITLDLHCPANVQFFRAIKVAFKKQQAEPFQICGLSIDTLSV